MLKDKIMKLYEIGDIVFDEETVTPNLVIVITPSHHSNPILRIIRLGSFKPMKLGLPHSL